VSASAVQSALIRLVRFPDSHRGEALELFLADLDLTDRERWQVRSLASSPYVAKFGREQRAARFRNSVRQVIPLTTRVCGGERLERLFAPAFEPTRAALTVAAIAREFVAFLGGHRDAWAPSPDGPVDGALVCDLARFEFAEFTAFGSALHAWRVPEGSLLRPDVPLLVLDFEHDLAGWVDAARALGADAPLPPAPPARGSTILFAKVPKADEEDAYVVHQFEIDLSVKTFVAAESAGGARPSTRPACFDDLVALGLCRANAGRAAP
jgi:hypothetical protein